MLSTDKMVADFITKPIQGSIFVCRRNTTQGMSKEDFYE